MMPRLLTILLFALLVGTQVVHGLYFYLEQFGQKCFTEDLPADTVVVGHYMVEEHTGDRFDVPTDLRTMIVIRDLETQSTLSSQRAPSEGKFAFTTHHDGIHQFCLSIDYSRSNRPHHGSIRLHLDMVVGDARPNHYATNHKHVQDLASRVQNLNALVRDIRREQRYQRTQEGVYRALADQTKSRAVYWSLVQICALVATCCWQLTHLRTFFSKKKLY